MIALEKHAQRQKIETPSMLEFSTHRKIIRYLERETNRKKGEITLLVPQANFWDDNRWRSKDIKAAWLVISKLFRSLPQDRMYLDILLSDTNTSPARKTTEERASRLQAIAQISEVFRDSPLFIQGEVDQSKIRRRFYSQYQNPAYPLADEELVFGTQVVFRAERVLPQLLRQDNQWDNMTIHVDSKRNRLMALQVANHLTACLEASLSDPELRNNIYSIIADTSRYVYTYPDGEATVEVLGLDPNAKAFNRFIPVRV